MPAGRPTSYTPEIVEAAWSYVNGGWKDEGDIIPSVEGLSVVIGIARSTIYKWSKEEDKEFSDILDDLLSRQGRTLLNGGLSGEMNSTISKLVLGKHDYSDKVSQDNTSSDGSHGGVVNINLNPVAPKSDSE